MVDHSVQVDFAGSAQALQLNMEMEFKRNRERYQFLKWGQQAFKTFGLVPPGIGIVHQVNLEYLAKGVLAAATQVNGESARVYYPDTLVGTDSHTTMINGLGVVGWGVGGIEAEAGMLGQPVYFLTPEVVGVHLTGELREGVTATDLALHITQMLRAQKVVGKFVEFYGEGAASLPVADRATIGNMSPEYGATMGFFPIDDESVAYLRATGRTEEQCAAFEAYFRAQKMFGMPRRGRDRLQRRFRRSIWPRCSRAWRGRSVRRIASTFPSWARLSVRSLRSRSKMAATARPSDSLGKRFPLDLNGRARPTNGDLEPASVQSPTDTAEGMRRKRRQTDRRNCRRPGNGHEPSDGDPGRA